MKNKFVLDFGCGHGAQTIEFINSGCKIIALDLEHNCLQTLTDQLNNHGIGKIIAVQYDGSYLPLATSSIDIVVSYEVIEHVLDEAEALRDIHRVLKPGGEIVISVPNKGWVFETHGVCIYHFCHGIACHFFHGCPMQFIENSPKQGSTANRISSNYCVHIHLK